MSTAYQSWGNSLTNGARQSKTFGRGGKGVDPRRPATPLSRDQRNRPKKETCTIRPLETADVNMSEKDGHFDVYSTSISTFMR